MPSHQQTAQGFNPRSYDIFAGLDVDKRSLSVIFRDHQDMIKSMRIPYSAEHLVNYTRHHFMGRRIAFAYEAGPTGFGLYDRLTEEGFPCLVVSPAMVPQAANERVKTNRLDAKKIAESLRGGQLKTVHVPSIPYRHLRHLVQLRDTAVRQVAAGKCRIKALLLYEGLTFPQAPAGSQWSQGVIGQLRELPCAPAVRFKLDSLLAALSFHQNQSVGALKEIRRFCRRDPELSHCITLLQSIPGVGGITASHLLARLGDWREIRNVRQIAAFLGLVASEDSTGDRVRRGSITRLGDSRLRNKMIQAAWSAIRRDPELREFYRRIYQRHPRDRAAKKAIVAVARKMTTRIHAVLKEQRPYAIRWASSAPLTEEETLCPRERLDDKQNEEGADLL